MDPAMRLLGIVGILYIPAFIMGLGCIFGGGDR